MMTVDVMQAASQMTGHLQVARHKHDRQEGLIGRREIIPSFEDPVPGLTAGDVEATSVSLI